MNKWSTSDNASVIKAEKVSKNHWNYRDKIPLLIQKLHKDWHISTIYHAQSAGLQFNIP